MTATPGKRSKVALWGLAAVFVVAGALLALKLLGDDSGARRGPIAGFGEIGFRVERSGKLIKEGCLLLADSTPQHQRGLMDVTDLRGYDGMLFRFPTDTSDQFYMKDTPMPLSIAWIDATGRLVSSTDMAPCLVGTSCPTYGAKGPYRYALEVPKGHLPKLGIGPDSTFEPKAGC